jgi:hypothetical protein
MPQGPLPRQIVITAFAAGLALQLLQASIVGDERWIPEHLAQFGAGAAVWLFATWHRARWVVRIAAIGFLIVLVTAYVANAFGVLPGPPMAPGHRNGLWWRDPNLLGVALASTAALASMLVTRARWTALPMWGAALVVAVASWARGPVIAILLGALTWGWTRYGPRGRWRMGAVAVLVVAASVASLAYAPERWSRLFGAATVERFVGGDVLDTTGTGGVFARLRSHEAGWAIAAAHWPWGAGVGGFADAYRTLVAPEARHALDHAHHQLIHLVAVGGVLGLLAWLSPLVAALWGLGARAWWMLAPLVATQAFLWGSETPLLFAGAFYAIWSAIGLARQVSTGTWVVRTPCDRRAGPITASPAPPLR